VDADDHRQQESDVPEGFPFGESGSEIEQKRIEEHRPPQHASIASEKLHRELNYHERNNRSARVERSDAMF
jgi:hypothetical protein